MAAILIGLAALVLLAGLYRLARARAYARAAGRANGLRFEYELQPTRARRSSANGRQ